jgi:hypothetical protein
VSSGERRHPELVEESLSCLDGKSLRIRLCFEPLPSRPSYLRGELLFLLCRITRCPESVLSVSSVDTSAFPMRVEYLTPTPYRSSSSSTTALPHPPTWLRFAVLPSSNTHRPLALQPLATFFPPKLGFVLNPNSTPNPPHSLWVRFAICCLFRPSPPAAPGLRQPCSDGTLLPCAVFL